MSEVVVWNLPKEDIIPILGEETLWVMESRKVEEFCSNIFIDPQSKLFSTIEKKFSKKCKRYFEGDRLVVEDATTKREFSYQPDKKMLVLEASKAIRQTDVQEAEEKEIPIIVPNIKMKMTVWTGKKLHQALKDVESEFCAYDVQRLLECLGVPVPFRLTWKENRMFSVQSLEEQDLAEIYFSGNNQIAIKQAEQSVCYTVTKENKKNVLKKVV